MKTIFLILTLTLTCLLTSLLAQDLDQEPEETSRSVNGVCYGVLGCFSNEGPFSDLLYRPLQPLPDSPGVIKASFTLYTRQNLHTPQILKPWVERTISKSEFNGERKTKIIVHGYMNNKHSPWVKDMSDRLLGVGDYNVICVDWLLGAFSMYQQAAVNTRVVGAEIWYLVTKLQKLKSLKNEDIHIIGHSLGAHIAGYAGSRLPGLARISGLDPAQPYFQNMDTAVRLDETDAIFVDVIHTDSKSFISRLATGGYGMSQPCGHIDFYPNGGEDQPECSTSDTLDVTGKLGILAGARMFITCNHQRAVSLYADSINPSNCQLTGFPCRNYEDFKAGQCRFCGRRCLTMGFNNDQTQEIKSHPGQKYYLDTAGHFRYCRENNFLTFAMSRDMPSITGRIYVNIQTDKDATYTGIMTELTEGPESFSAGEYRTFTLQSKRSLGSEIRVKLQWKASATWLGWGILGNTGDESLHIDSLTIRNSQQRDVELFSNSVLSDAAVTTETVKGNRVSESSPPPKLLLSTKTKEHSRKHFDVSRFMYTRSNYLSNKRVKL